MDSTELTVSNDIAARLATREHQIGEYVGHNVARKWTNNVARAIVDMEPEVRAKLAQCERYDVESKLMDACSLGLWFGTSMAEAFLVPIYDKRAGRMKCNLWLHYRGLLKLARRPGPNRLTGHDVGVVVEGDEFRYSAQPKELRHVPTPGSFARWPTDENTNIVAAYAVLYFESGHTHIEVVWRGDLATMRRRTPAWLDHPGEQSKKCALRRGLKHADLALDAYPVVEHDDEISHASIAAPAELPPPAPTRGRTSFASLSRREQKPAIEPATANGDVMEAPGGRQTALDASGGVSDGGGTRETAEASEAVGGIVEARPNLHAEQMDEAFADAFEDVEEATRPQPVERPDDDLHNPDPEEHVHEVIAGVVFEKVAKSGMTFTDAQVHAAAAAFIEENGGARGWTDPDELEQLRNIARVAKWKTRLEKQTTG